MAVAVASIQPASQMSTIHAQAAQDALLDALLSSCEKPTNPPLKSFGRDLQPYFPVVECTTSLAKKTNATHKRDARNKSSLQPVASAAAAAAASSKHAVPAAMRAHNGKLGNAVKKGPVNKAKSVPLKKEDAAAFANTIQAPNVTSPLLQLNSGDMDAILAWAGPGFYVAPSPEKLPLPTTALLE